MLRKIIYHSHDSDRYKIDDTPQGQESANIFRDHVYQMLTDRGNPRVRDSKLGKWIDDYTKDLPNGPSCTFKFLFDIMERRMDQDIAARNAKASSAVNPVLYLGSAAGKEDKDPKKPKSESKGKGGGKGKEEKKRRQTKKPRDAAPAE
eukprot:9828043-Karenia_brevis.AAC.1